MFGILHEGWKSGKETSVYLKPSSPYFKPETYISWMGKSTHCTTLSQPVFPPSPAASALGYPGVHDNMFRELCTHNSAKGVVLFGLCPRRNTSLYLSPLLQMQGGTGPPHPVQTT